MTSPRRFEQDLPALLADLYLAGTPDYRDDIVRRIARTSQRPAWAFPERWLPMDLVTRSVPTPAFPWRQLALLALLAGLVATALAVYIGAQQRVPEPFGLARNGSVVFERDGDILLAETVAGEPRGLVTGPERDSYPTFSRQGTHIAFMRDVPIEGASLMVARADGSGLTTIGGPFQQLDRYEWSPDGTTIAVGWLSRGYFRVSLVATDGSGTTDFDLGMPADLPTWHPDGRQLAFRGQPGDGTQAAAVYLVNADGSNLRRLDLGPPVTDQVVEFEGLAWSPDGAHLSYMRDAAVDGALGWRIHVADVDPTGVVTDVRQLRLHPESTQEMLPVWSPDGTRIAFILERHGTRQIAVAPVDGSAAPRLIGPVVAAAVNVIGYAWSPDGETVLVRFVHDAGQRTLTAVDLRTGAETELDPATIVNIPTWQRLAP